MWRHNAIGFAHALRFPHAVAVALGFAFAFAVSLFVAFAFGGIPVH